MYRLSYTDTFEDCIKRYKKNKSLMKHLYKKIGKLKVNPKMGKELRRGLVGYKSLRIDEKFRLVFKVDEFKKEIILIAFGHREFIYDYTIWLVSEKK